MSSPRCASAAALLPLVLASGIVAEAGPSGGEKPGNSRSEVPIRIEILPGEGEKWIDPLLAERIPVAVFGGPRFDVHEIVPSTLILSGAVIAKDDDGTLATYRDVDGDGVMDMLVQFPSSRIRLGEKSTRAALSARCTDGRFVTASGALSTVERARSERRLAARPDNRSEKLPPAVVQIQLVPRDAGQSVELGNRGTLTVALLSTTGFDATRVDPTTVHLAGSPATRRTKGGLASFEDVNADGRADLVVEVSKKLLRLDAASREVTLTAQSPEGRFLMGTAPVSIAKTARMIFDSDDPPPTLEPDSVDYANNGAITINDLAAATPYPSTINVFGLPGVISKVRVTLKRLSHTSPIDIDVLLVGPTGQSVRLMSDVGGGVPGVTNVTLTFDDDAALPIEVAVAPTTGTYRPSNAGALDPFSAPAPSPSGATGLTAFDGTVPNGAWSLYIVDDGAVDTGVISGGWAIDFVLAAEFCNPSGAIVINDLAPATPYPATIPVAGITGVISKVTAVVRGLTHTFPGDIEMLLVGPTGQPAMLMSDTAGGNPGVFDVTLILDDNAALTLEPSVNPVDGTYTPSDELPGDSLPAPAPAAPYPNALSVYQGTDPNGTWSVYLADDAGSDVGVLGRICLYITSMTPVDHTNPAAMNIPAGAPGSTSGAASPYPSTISVSGVIGTVERASVNLRGLSHTFPRDLDVLLRSPSGANVMLMSDVDGGNPGVSNVTYIFDDDAAAPLPTGSNAPSGVYKPTNDNSAGADTLPAPAPAGPYGTALHGVTGRSPNGNWDLYVFDDQSGDVGSIASGWVLSLMTDLPADGGGCNLSGMTIPAGAPGSTAGPSSAFPAGVVHVGVPVDLDQYKVRVDLLGLTHSYPRDLDVLLVGPQGQKVLVMSDAAGGGPGVSNVTLSLQDDAAAPIPELVNPTTGFYRPSEYEAGDGFNGPAPPGPYATNLSAFKGTNPLGSWALYVQDDATGDVGSLSGWCLNFIPSIDAGDVPDMIFFGSGSSSIAWSPSPNATSYNIYRGEPSQLPGLLNGTVDSCRRFETLTQTFTGLTDIPPLGSFYWYIVRGANAQGEGASGVSHVQGQALARVVDSSGSCP